MLLAKKALVLGFLGLGFAACTSGSGLTGGDKKSDGKKEEDDGEEEDDDADPPQEITGAYLTTTCADSPELPADAGMKAMACSVKKDDAKVEVTSPSVVCNFSDGTSESPAVTPAPPASEWNFYFQIPKAKRKLLTELKATYTHEGKPQEVAKTAAELASPVPNVPLDGSVILAFTTKAKFSTAGTMTFDGISGANAVCQASAYKYGGTWRAILSADGEYPELKLDRLVKSAAKGATMPSFNVENFWDEAEVLFTIDEEGNPIPPEDYVWTGIVASKGETVDTCAQWTDEPLKVGTISKPFADDWLTSTNVDDCNQNHHLYCIQQY